MLGTFERNIGWYFIYRSNLETYNCYQAQGMRHICTFPPGFNAWQSARDIKIWLLATGNITDPNPKEK